MKNSMTLRILRLGAPGLLLLTLLPPGALLAQSGGLGSQQLGRPYLFLFLAYALGWALIFGWVLSIARRLRSLERRLGTDRE